MSWIAYHEGVLKILGIQVGFGNLDLPARELETVAFWLVPPGEALLRVREYQRVPEEGLLGIANVACAVLPLFVMCDPQDIGTVVDSSQVGSPAIFIHFSFCPGSRVIFSSFMPSFFDLATTSAYTPGPKPASPAHLAAFMPLILAICSWTSFGRLFHLSLFIKIINGAAHRSISVQRGKTSCRLNVAVAAQGSAAPSKTPFSPAS